MAIAKWFVEGSLALFIGLATPAVNGATEAVDADPVLTVTRSGSGSGSVASTPGSIACGATCSQSFTSGTQVTLSAAPGAGNEFTGWLGPCTGIASCTFAITKDTTAIAGFAPSLTGTPVLDIDGNGAFDAWTDGLLVLRYLFGLQGAALINNAIGPNATRTTPLQVQAYLDDIRPALDMDGNGRVDALTDGLLMVRYLFGLRGAALINGVIGAGATRDTAPLVESALAGFTNASAQIPPDPTTVAQPNDGTVANTLFDSTKFIYSGSPPIQTGVAPGTINYKLAAVIRGKVSARDGTPIPMVKITIMSHPEFGQTYTRTDGMFDMVVNGGTVYTVNYTGDGYLPAQRGINIPWQQYVVAPDVVLVPLDPAKTQVTLSGAVQSARGSVVTDADGTRQATVIFPAGTTASLVMPNGSTQPVSTLTVRATEYTVGPTGPNAMPGGLPPASGYTYAVEFSADEAIAAGATGVSFNQPVAIYVENFLSFPAASQVPAGYYDKQQGKWIPQNNGRVIQVVSITGGMADLDVNGDGIADTGTALSSIGITDAERTQLAPLYAPGQSLWRVTVTHFSPFDFNFPYGPPAGADKPKPRPKPPKGGRPRGGDPCQKAGSIIHCQTQAIGEEIPVAGSKLRLHYVSDRVPGRKAVNTLATQISDAMLPPGLVKIHVEVRVAGRVFTTHYDPLPNLTHTFEWDGIDSYGRPLNGRQPVNIKVGYEYVAQYYSTQDTLDASYNRFAAPPIRQALVGGGGSGGAVAFSHSNMRAAAPTVTIWSETQGSVGGFYSRGTWLGGWTLTEHHAYDTVGHNLYLGDGSVRGTDDRMNTISSIAGSGSNASYQNGIPATQSRIKAYRVQIGRDGSVYFRDVFLHQIRRIRPDGIVVSVAGNGIGCGPAPCGDGQPATNAAFNFDSSVMGFALAPDGSFYFVDSAHYIRKVGADGILSTVAGSGQDCLVSSTNACGDGLPGRQAAMNPDVLAFGPDGSLYFSDSTGRIRRLGADGIVYPFAGGANIICVTGTQACGDGNPATQAKFIGVTAMSVGPDGSVYVADANANRIRRISTDGIITNFAGDGNVCGVAGCGDGGPAATAQFRSPFDVLAADDGTVYIAEGNGSRVRRVIPSGIITTFAGNGVNSDSPDGDGGLATAASLSSPHGLAVAPDGTFVIAHLSGTRIRMTTTVLPALQAAEFMIASEDGREVYLFDYLGRHVRTLNALTSATSRTFAYDGAGRLISITDGDGNVTTIERAPSGDATAIVAPGGQRTQLLIDSGGWLTKVTNPADEKYQMTYVGGASPGGLLSTFTDPAGHASVFTWDSDGLLLKDEDPAGGTTTLARAEVGDNRYTVTLTTDGGLISVVDVEDLPNGDTRRIRTDPTGAQTTYLYRSDGSGRVTSPDGTITDYTQAPDPRFGMQAPLVSSVKVTTPGGVIGTRTATRTVTLSNVADPFSMTKQTDTVIVNGKTHTMVYDAATRKVTATSAAGKQFVITLDGMGRVIDQLDDPPSGQASTHYTYDAQGRIARVQQGAQYWDYAYDAQNRQVSRTDAAGKAMTYAYDAVGRRTGATTPAGRVYGTMFDLDGNPTQYTMPSTSVHSLAYSPIDLADHYTPPGGTALVTHYDTNARMTSVTLPDGRSETLTFDAGGRPSGVAYPEAAIAYGYGAGDKTNRIASMTRTPAGGGTAQGAAYAYDGGLVSSLTLTGSAPGTYAYTYDTSFRVANATFTSGADNVPVARTRDNDGLLTGLGPFTLTRAGASGNVSQIGDGTLTQAMTYDSLARLTGRTHTVAGQAAFSVQLTFDASARLTQKVESISGTPHTFVYSYDPDGQLTMVTRDGVVAEQYLYDANRNRISRQIGNAAAVQSTYDTQDRIVSQGALAYTLDASGFLVQRGADAFTYSTTGELLQSNVGGVGATYAYDALRRRVSRTVNAATTQYFYGDADDHSLLTHSRDGAGVLSTYYYDEGRRLFAIQRGATRYYVATDQLGSPRAVIDGTGAVVKAIEYDAFGVVTSDSAPGFDLAVGFAGGLADPATGFVRFGPRDYDPQSGRWTSRDPVLHAGQQANLFAYVNNDPVNVLDPSGLFGLGFSVCDGACVGLKWAVTSQGLSACVDGGFGSSGTSVEVDPFGDLDKNSAALELKGSIKAGIGKVDLTSGLEMDDCFTIRPKGKVEACVGPVCEKLFDPTATPKDKFSIDEKTGRLKNPFEATKGGFDKPKLKVGLRICQQLKF